MRAEESFSSEPTARVRTAVAVGSGLNNPTMVLTERASPTLRTSSLSRVVAALGVGVDVGLRVPGRFELLLRIERGLVEPVMGRRIA